MCSYTTSRRCLQCGPDLITAEIFYSTITSTLRFVKLFRGDLFLHYPYNGSVLFIWTLVDPGVYFMAAVLITVRPLFPGMFEDVTFLSYISKNKFSQARLLERIVETDQTEV
jgi:hypothetical protein